MTESWNQRQEDVRLGQIIERLENMKETQNARHAENTEHFAELRHSVANNRQVTNDIKARMGAVEKITSEIEKPLAEFMEARKHGKWLIGLAFGALTVVMTIIHYSEDIFDGLKWVFVRGGK